MTHQIETRTVFIVGNREFNNERAAKAYLNAGERSNDIEQFIKAIYPKATDRHTRVLKGYILNWLAWEAEGEE